MTTTNNKESNEVKTWLENNKWKEEIKEKKWIKFDLHHHTYSDTINIDKTRHRNLKDIKKMINIYLQENEKYDNKGIGCLIYITDHYKISCDAIKKYKQHIKDESLKINIGPGVELGFKLYEKNKDEIKEKYDELCKNYLSNEKNKKEDKEYFKEQNKEKKINIIREYYAIKIDVIFLFNDSLIPNDYAIINSIIKKVWSVDENNEKFNRIDIEENFYLLCNKFLTSKFEFITSVHWLKSSSDLFKMKNKNEKKYLGLFNYFDLFEGKQFATKYLEIIKKTAKKAKETTGNNFNTVWGTDARFIECSSQGCNECFKHNIKKVPLYYAENNFNGLKKISEYKHRIKSIQNDNEVLYWVIDNYITSIEINNQKIFLDKGVNIIIGRRGGGKTYLYNSIKHNIQKEIKINNNNKINNDIKVNFKEKEIEIGYKNQNELAVAISDSIEYSKLPMENELKTIRKDIAKKFEKIWNKKDKIKKLKNSLKLAFKNIVLKNIENQKIKNPEAKIRISLLTIIKNRMLKMENDKIIKKMENDQKSINKFLKTLDENNTSWLKIKIKEIDNNIKNMFKNNKYKTDFNIKCFLKVLDDLSKKQSEKSDSSKLEVDINDLKIKIIKTCEELQDLKSEFKEELSAFHNEIIEEYNDKKFEKGNKKIKSNLESDVDKKIINTKMEIKIKSNNLLLEFLDNNFKNKDMSWNELCATELKIKTLKTDGFTKLFKLWIEKKVESITSVYIGDALIDNYSMGQQHEAYLKEFFKSINKKDIIMIDQPENDLDNQTINSVIIKQFQEWGFKKQVIVVTNNPLLAINSDPQSIILSNYKNNIELGSDIQYTSIKTSDLNQDKIIKLLDGDKSYLRNRFINYGGYNVKWKKNNN